MIKRGKNYEELCNELKSGGITWNPSMAQEFYNSNGNISTSSLGYQYTTQTTTLIRAKVITQKFYEVPPAEFVPIDIGEGAFMETIDTNLVYQASGDFERGIVSVADPSNVAQVSVGLAPIAAKIVSWAMGYQYSNMEVEKALAADNWDVVSAKVAALKKTWDLGIQKIAFLGSKSDVSGVPGLLSNSQVTVDISTITGPISGLSAADFSILVKALLAAYFTNSNSTVLPDTFVIPMSDYLGLAVPVSSGFPVVSMLTYLLDAFKQITQNPNFVIKGLAYADQANNTGYWASGGTNRYTLYRRDPETIRMTIPVDMILNAPGTANNFNWNGVGVGQFTGAIVYRPAELYYLDWAA